MKLNFRKLSDFTLLLTAATLMLWGVGAGAQALPQITQRVSDSNLTTLQNNLHPLAKAIYDKGAVPDSTPTGRLLLILKRPVAQENALHQFLSGVQIKGNPNYHKWLTPAQFGQKYGLADSDLTQIESWLQSHGFTIDKVGAGRTAIEFSGTAGQVSTAFHTSLHIYNVNSEVHHANAANPQIPAAFASVIAGVASLNDFHPKSQMKNMGRATYDLTSHKVTPQWTVSKGTGGTGGVFYAIGPKDFATQYDVTPLYKAGVTGTGQTIGIINDSNINLALVSAYRNLYGLDANPATPNLPQVIIDGDDPGVTGDAGEAYLDVELSGAVAPQATVNLYIAADTDYNDGLDLAMLRAVEDDTATVLSLSFGGCEAEKGAAYLAYIDSLWEQAAAQGQTVMVSTGDSGSAGCDNADDIFAVAEDGLQVNGLASTPWNIAVGGTDFYYSDYATGGASITQDWNSQNDMNLGSLIAPLPEQPWNTSSYGLDIYSTVEITGEAGSIAAGSGGQSTCAVAGGPLAGTNALTAQGLCEGLGGYAKPAWQSGPGVPSDGVRDLPDISLFASSGANDSFYAMCIVAGDCVNTNPETNAITYSAVGGTSASAPAFAAIMALINQKYGPQGQADAILYPLAVQMPSVFHDVTVGTNNVPCEPGAGLQCIPDKGDNGDSLQEWPATIGYDLASGLGSVDANALVTNWNSVTLGSTSLTFSATPTSITHGQPMTMVASVLANSGSAIPTGIVAVIADTTLPSNKGQIALPLDNTGSGAATVNFLPGGTYNIYGSYSGDATYAASQSSPVSITVAPENSIIQASAFQNQTSPFAPQTPLGQSVAYGTIVGIDLQINGVNAPAGTIDGVATGTVTFMDNGAAIATLPLNANGASVLSLGTWAVGQHSLTFSYSGDPSYNATTTSNLKAPLTFTVTQAPTFLQTIANSTTLSPGEALVIQAVVAGNGTGLSPSGNVVFTLGQLTQTVALAPTENAESLATATFTNLAVGTYTLGISYAGDTNWSASSAANQPVTVGAASSLLPSTTVVTTNPVDLTTVVPGTLITLTAAVTGASAPPTGSVLFVTDGEVFSSAGNDEIPLTPGSRNTSTASITFTAVNADFGSNQVYAIYSGDNNYNTSSSPVLVFNNAQGDFAILNNTPTLTVVSGSPATANLTLSSNNQFSGNITLTCSVTGSGTVMPLCTVPGTVAVAATGQAQASVQLVTTIPTATAQMLRPASGKWPLSGGSATAFAFLVMLILPTRRQRWSGILGLFLCLAFCGVLSGCSNSSPATPPPPGPTLVPAGAYKAVVTATDGLTTHNVVVNLVVTAPAK
jgi:trimeric autotransporter adhesin